MFSVLTHPLTFGVFCFACLFVCAWFGGRLRSHPPRGETFDKEESSLAGLEASVLGLLALLIGFTFSMGVSRFDAHIETEVNEANTIGTVYGYLDTLPADAHTRAEAVMQQLVQSRLQFSTVNSSAEMSRIVDRTTQLESQLWTIANSATPDHRDDVQGNLLQALSNMSDAMERRTAAVENRIPVLAWVMLLFIGCVGAGITGMRLHAHSVILMGTLPLILSVVLMLIYDLDSPHNGLIQVDQSSMQRMSNLTLQTTK